MKTWKHVVTIPTWTSRPIDDWWLMTHSRSHQGYVDVVDVPVVNVILAVLTLSFHHIHHINKWLTDCNKFWTIIQSLWQSPYRSCPTCPQDPMLPCLNIAILVLRAALKQRLCATSSAVLCACCRWYLTTGWDYSWDEDKSICFRICGGSTWA